MCFKVSTRSFLGSVSDLIPSATIMHVSSSEVYGTHVSKLEVGVEEE